MSKIPLNGFGRIGRLAMTGQTLPLMNKTAKAVFDEGIERERQRELERLDEMPDPDTNTYVITRKPDEPLVGPVYSLPTKAMYKHSGGQKPNGYAKKKKAKRHGEFEPDGFRKCVKKLCADILTEPVLKQLHWN